MADVIIAESSNRTGRTSARDNATVHIGNNFSPRTFQGGYHNHGLESDVTRDTVLRDLALHSYKERKDINPERVPNTCEWFLSHQRYKQWRQHRSSSMLRVSADPGCGKSVLAKYLVDEELRSTDKSTTCYFFFKDGLGDQSSATMALRCIIHQILVQCPILFSDTLLKKFRQTSYILTSTIELWDIIVKISSNSEAGEIIIVLDAFDECNKAGRVELEKMICQFYSKEHTESNLKLILTSRPHEIVARGFRGMEMSDLPVLHLAGEDEEEVRMIAKEIDLVIAARVKELAIRLDLTSAEAEDLRTRLSGFNNRTYLWVYLTLDVIENAERTSHSGISSIIKHLPKSVYDAYEKILDRSSDDTKARKLLEVMLAATRPLKLAEMSEALEIEEHHSSYAEIRVTTEPKVQRHLRELCGLFIVVIHDEVFFLHQTAREFLLGNETLEPSKGKGRRPTASYRTASYTSFGSWKWAHTIEMQQAQCRLSQLCVKYLLLSDFSNDKESSQHQSGVRKPVSAFDFLKYASQNWYKHCRTAAFAGTSTRALLWLLGYPDGEANSRSWRKSHDDDGGSTFKDLTPLMLASNLGLTPAVNVLIEADPEFAKDTHHLSGRSALSFAAEQGFDDVVELLLHCYKHKLRKSCGVVSKHIDNSDINGQTPLSFAAFNGHTVVAKRLLKAGARLDVRDRFHGTPTSYGLCSEDDQMVKLMLSRTSQSDQRLLDKSLADILSFAVLQGDTRIIARIISTKRLHAGSTCPSRQDLEEHALRQKYTFASTVTLVRGHTSSELRHVSARTVSQLAASAAEMSFFKSFEDIGDPINVQDCDLENGSTLLHWAAAFSKDSGAIIEELLSRGASIDRPDNVAGFTPLHWALWARNYYNATLLLSRGADIQLRTLDNRSALKMGFWPGNAVTFLNHDKSLFELACLLDHEKDLVMDFVFIYKKARPVTTKPSRRYIESISAAQQVNAPQRVISSIKFDERKYMPSLQCWEDEFHTQAGFDLKHLAAAAASLEGRFDVLGCLLRSGLSVTFQDSQGRTLLHLLPPPSETALLLDLGTDPNIQDRRGRTALHEAAWRGPSDMVELLLRRGADPGIQDEDGMTPLQETLFIALCAASPDPILQLGAKTISAFGVEYYFPTVEVEAIISNLLKTGTAIDAQNRDGLTALHMAAEGGLWGFARRLIEAGASTSVRDTGGNTPLQRTPKTINSSWRSFWGRARIRRRGTLKGSQPWEIPPR